MTVRVPNEIAAYIRRIAAETGKSNSQIVTEMLAERVKRNPMEDKK